MVVREGMELITESGKTSLVLEKRVNADHLGGKGRGSPPTPPPLSTFPCPLPRILEWANVGAKSIMY